MASVTSLGRVQPLYKGAYSSGIPYHRLDNVYYNGNTYVCQVETVSDINPAEDSSIWQIVAAKGTKGDRGLTGGFGQPTGQVSLHSADDQTATVSIIASGSDEAKIFDFRFDLPRGPKAFDTISASATAIQAGSDPSARVSLVQSAGSTSWNLGFEFDIPAANGEGIKKLDDDNTLTPDGQGNVNYYGVRYVGQTLSDAQKIIARENIGAQPSGDYIISPAVKTQKQYLCYEGDNQWSTKPIDAFPAGGTSGQFLQKISSGIGTEWAAIYQVPTNGSVGQILTKTAYRDEGYGWTTLNIISNNDIDTIVSDN